MKDETLGEALARIRAEAGLLGAVHVEVELDQLEARLADERDARLFPQASQGHGTGG